LNSFTGANGLYDKVVTEAILRQLASAADVGIENVSSPASAGGYLLDLVREEIGSKLTGLKVQDQIDLVNTVLKTIGVSSSIPTGTSVQVLNHLFQNHTDDSSFKEARPLTPLRELALLTNAKGEPNMSAELNAELASADRVDIVMSFVKHSGLNLIYGELKKLRQRGIPVRLVTTVYMGATDKSALDLLVRDLGVSVKVDLEAKRARLHAKAWLISRNSGYSTAYIGSSNMSDAALTTGAEWNVRLSEEHSAVLLDKFSVAFDTYWASPDYRDYEPERDGALLEEALARADFAKSDGVYTLLSSIQVEPHDYQREMLEDLRVSREIHGHHQNLVVAATGTGKTVLAALDYRSFVEGKKGYPKLLFVAHRKEILQQALVTFRQVLQDASFGELLVDGAKPTQWNYVFASIQSLKAELLEGLGAQHFEHLIVDEFHRGEAPSYKKLFSILEPAETLALTATPERTDGVDEIQRTVFGGRFATELRLWDALDRELLTPFHYFGIGEDIDYSSVKWVAGGYDKTELTNLITRNQVRNVQVWNELIRKVANPSGMKALAFCASVEHAEQVAEFFNSRGLQARSVTGETQNRDAILNDLRSGAIQVVTAVDVFNEGVDIRELDTILMLRPTESPVVFLQQLGRGLRKYPGKTETLVLDFIGSHRAEYRLDKKFQVLSGLSRGEIIQNLKHGFPYLPSGTSIQLDELASEKVLSGIKNQVGPARSNLLAEIAGVGTLSLKAFLEMAGREIWEVYRHASWRELLVEAGLISIDGQEDLKWNHSVAKRLVHVDDKNRLHGYLTLLTQPLEPWQSVSDYEKRLRSMLFWGVWPNGRSESTGREWESVDEGLLTLQQRPTLVAELAGLFEVLFANIKNVGEVVNFANFESPLLAHATYSRNELVGAIGWAHLAHGSINADGSSRAPEAALEGVFRSEPEDVDLFLVTLEKGDHFSPSTRFHDYAISDQLFHWESQSRTSPDTPVGKRYLNQPQVGNDILIGVRESSQGTFGFTPHFKLLGLADFVSSKGSKPMKVIWKLRTPMDVQTYKVAAAVKVS
jgi:superfamily II DNA or RNA helicase/HKD family nuclease